MSTEDVPTIKYPLVEHAKEALDGWLAFYIINTTTPMLKKAPQWQRIFLFSLYFEVIFAIIFAIVRRRLTDGTDGETMVLPILATISVIALFFAVNIGSVIAKSTIDILHTKVAPNLPPAISERAGRMLKKRFSLQKQLLVSIPAATIVVIIDFIELSSDYDDPSRLLAILFFSGILMVAFLSLGSILLFLGSLSFLPGIFVEGQVEIYPLDPRESPLVQGSLTIAQRTVWVLVIVMMIYLGVNVSSIVLLDLCELLLLIPIAIALVVIGIAALFFTRQQLSLSLLIDARRTRTLFELQEMLSALYARGDSLSKDELARKDDLLATHDRVIQTGERAFDLLGTLRFFFPLLLPLLSALPFGEAIINALPFGEEIIDFINQILPSL